MSKNQNTRTETKLRFHVVQDELFIDLNLFQFGWEKCGPLHQWGPAIRNHYLFHYIISGKGRVEVSSGAYTVEAGQGFLLCPQQVSTYYADHDDPWTYTWVEFDGLRARECMTLAGLSKAQPIYTPGAGHGHNELEQCFMNLIDTAGQAPIRLVGLGMVLMDEIVQTSKARVSSSKDNRLREFYIKEALTFIDRNYHRDNGITIWLRGIFLPFPGTTLHAQGEQMRIWSF
ncbi:MAG: AraC family ligand binding domain-containing protein [Oscillospiraceae bacterium]|nr:AraC family ligand binding domain-containing protein [Oscillospiraceae bacterium]